MLNCRSSAKENTCADRYRRTPSTHFASNYVHAFLLATLAPPSLHDASHTLPMATQSGGLFQQHRRNKSRGRRGHADPRPLVCRDHAPRVTRLPSGRVSARPRSVVAAANIFPYAFATNTTHDATKCLWRCSSQKLAAATGVKEKPELSVSCGWDSHAHPHTHRPSTHVATLPARPRTTHAGIFRVPSRHLASVT